MRKLHAICDDIAVVANVGAIASISLVLIFQEQSKMYAITATALFVLSIILALIPAPPEAWQIEAGQQKNSRGQISSDEQDFDLY